MKRINTTEFIKKLTPYKVSERIPENISNDGIFKLDWNEASHTGCIKVKEKLIEFLQNNDLSSYPNPTNKRLIKLLASYSKVNLDEIQFFSGSDEALDYISKTFIAPNDDVVSLSPNYDNFRVFAEGCGGNYIEKFYDEAFKNEIENLMSISFKPKIIYISNPNNPMGNVLSINQIESILDKFNETLVIIDEAYYEFSEVSAAILINKYPNIIISRTMSKAFGMAGIRFGYLISNKLLIESINRIRNPKGINVLAQIAAETALENMKDTESYVQDVFQNKQRIIKWLKSKGKIVQDCKANFIMIKCKYPKKFVSEMLKNGILIRDRSSMPLVEGYVRMTIGGNETFEPVLKALNNSIDFIQEYWR